VLAAVQSMQLLGSVIIDVQCFWVEWNFSRVRCTLLRSKKKKKKETRYLSGGLNRKLY
jgi:hypothetical protein